MPKTRSVVLGGVGFIGSHLCRELLKRGHEVFAIDIRDITHAPMLRDAAREGAFHFIHHNIIHPFGIRCDEIYNLAAPSMVRYNRALPIETLRVAMVGSIHALDTARTEHARVVYASTGSLCDQNFQQDEGMITTTHKWLAESKHAAESLHRAYREECGVDTRIARIFNSYGPGSDLMDQRVVMKWVVAALQNRDLVIEGTGEQLRSFCYISDVVTGLITLMQALPANHTRTVHLGSEEMISLLDLAHKIIALTGSRSRIVHTVGRRNEAPTRSVNLELTHREMGWRPTVALDEGLRRTIGYVERELTERAGSFCSWIEINQ